MSDQKDHAGSEGRARERVIRKTVDSAVRGAPDERRKLPRGRVPDNTRSPRPGVRDPGKPHKGPEGEKAYGAPIDDRPEDRGKKKEK